MLGEEKQKMLSVAGQHTFKNIFIVVVCNYQLCVVSKVTSCSDPY